MGSDATVTTETHTVHVITARTPRGFARLHLDEAAGLCTLTSSWCEGSAYWLHRGKGVSLARFVAGIDSGYALDKLIPSAQHRVDDPDATRAAILEAIADQDDYDDDPSWDSDAERALADEVKQGSLTYEEWAQNTRLDEPWHCWRTKVNPQWTDLWSEVWEPHLRPALVALAER